MAKTEYAQGDANEASSPAENSSSKNKLLAAAIVSLVIVTESVVAFIIFPSAEDAAVLAQARIGESENPNQSVDGEGLDDNPLTEVALGDFTVSAYQQLRTPRCELISAFSGSSVTKTPKKSRQCKHVQSGDSANK